MNSSICRSVVAPLLGGLLMTTLAAGSADAASYPYRTELDATSRRVGLDRRSVPVLAPTAGRGTRVVADELVKKYERSTTAIATAGAYQVRDRAGRLRYLGDGWYLESLGDGSAVRYRNYKYLSEAAEAGHDLKEKLSESELESRGRAFISRELSRYVPLATGETLVAYESSHRIDSMANDAGTAKQTLGGSVVVFSRTIDGVGVVGPGSKIMVMFAADGTPVGFDFDWPSYAPTGKAQAPLDLASTHRRASSVLPNDPFGTDRTLERFECGYYDGGARKRTTTTAIQPACFYHYVSHMPEDTATGAAPMRAAFAEPVPVGSSVEADPRWPEAMLLCTGIRGCGSYTPRSPAADVPTLPLSTTAD